MYEFPQIGVSYILKLFLKTTNPYLLVHVSEWKNFRQLSYLFFSRIIMFFQGDNTLTQLCPH